MRSVLTALAAVLFVSPVLRADDAADAKAIVERALKARAGKPGSATAWKDKGTFHGLGMPVPYTAEWAFQGPDKYRFDIILNLADAKFNLKVVVNGEKAWEAEGAQSREITGPKLEYVRGEVYQLWVTSLAPLTTDKGFTLATAPGKDVGGKATVGVKVTRDKHQPITLYFDKETGLLAKLESTVMNEFQKWKPVPEEVTYSDYKQMNGVTVFTKLKVVRDGKLMIESEVTDAKEVEKLDAKLFEKP
jgi:hypothetical protein